MDKQKTGRQTAQKKKVKADRIPTGDINKDFDIITNYATSRIKNREGIEPTLFIIDSKKKRMGMVSGNSLPNNSDIKQKIFENIGEDYAKKIPGADLFIMIMEAWASPASRPDNNILPHEDPNRIEIYMVAGKKLNGEEKAFAQAFRRDVVTGEVGFLDRAEIKNLNIDWTKPGEKDGVYIENSLLSALWRKFMFTKILNNLK